MRHTNKKSPAIAANPNAARNYFIESRVETGIVLQGWEIKSLRKNRLNLKDGHARLINNEVWLIGAHISPLSDCDQSGSGVSPTRTRKLLLRKHEIGRLVGAVNRKGYSLVPTRAYWKGNFVKIELVLGKGKHVRDKRAAEKLRSWNQNKNRLLKKQPN